MPVYFRNSGSENYGIDAVEEIMKESVENAIHDYCFLDGDFVENLDYRLKLDDSRPHRIEGRLELYQNGEELQADLEMKNSRGKTFKLEYFDRVLSPESKALVRHLEDNLDSMLEMERIEEKRFKNTRMAKWRGSE